MTEQWPDEALNTAQVAEELGYAGPSGVEQAIRRTRLGTAREDFPEPDGWATPPDAARETPVRYWLPATIMAFKRQRPDAHGGKRQTAV